METVAALTNLEESEVSQDCSVLAVSGHTMQLRLPKPVGIGRAVKVEAEDTISLGEVSYCRPEGDAYVVWVDLMQALHHVGELSRLARALVS
jgi:hypothetical protein